MRRVVSLFLPTWSTDRLRRKTGKPPPDAPLVTAQADHGRRVVAAVDVAARRLGITPGMTVTRARSIVPELTVVDADPEDDLRGLLRLTLWAGKHYSPLVAPDPPEGIWLDITGCAHRFDGEVPMLKDMLRRIAKTGMAVQAAVAETAGCAHAVARQVRSGRPTIVNPGKARAALAILPIAALRIEPGVTDALHRMGFTRIEQLIAEAPGPSASSQAAPKIVSALQPPGAWREGRLMYDKARLADLVADINRYYGPGVRLDDPTLGDLRVTAFFTSAEIPSFLSALPEVIAVKSTEMPDGSVRLGRPAS